MPDDAVVLSDTQDPGFAVGYPSWSYGGVEPFDFLSLASTDTFIPQQSAAVIQPGIHYQQGLFSSMVSVPRSPTSAARSLVQRPRFSTEAQRFTDLIRRTLRSYPLMLRRHTLPPFIHPTMISLRMENAAMEPLTDCISLMQMISGGVNGSNRLFWDNVRRECERWVETYKELSRWDLLAAMQALLLYILIRLEEGETEHNNLDALLERAVIVMAQRISRDDIICHTDCALCNHGLDIGWTEWLFRESRRRLAIVYRIVNKLVYFGPAAMCDMPAEFILAPLPAKRQLWEACDEDTWLSESRKEPGAQTSYGLGIDGEIVGLDKTRLSCSDNWLPRSTLSPEAVNASSDGGSGGVSTCWEEWCAGIDAFGGLVMLAASLVV